MSVRIAFGEVKDAWEKDFLKKQFDGIAELVFFEGPVQDHVELLRDVSVLSVFVNSKVDKKLMDRIPGLKCVSTRSTGYDHIDLVEARERNIPVCTVPFYGENTVAEHTFALILSLSRNLRKAYLRTVQNNFSLEGLMGFDLNGKTLGVIGTGHIGLHVIRMGLGFGMKVIAFDTRKLVSLPEGISFDYVSFEELLGRSDVITLHVPCLPGTKHMINEKTIRLIKKGAVLVNTARGGLIETGALVQALDEGILSGVGLDVLEEEEYVLEEKRLLVNDQTEDHWRKVQTTLKNHVLLHRENVIFTPHMAFYSREAVQRILETTVNNIKGFLNGKIVNQVL